MKSENEELKAAADALVQATIDSTKENTQTIGRELSESLKTLHKDLVSNFKKETTEEKHEEASKNLESLSVEVLNLKSTTEQKFDEVNKNLQEVVKCLQGISETMTTTEKRQTLEFAIANGDIGSFDYRTHFVISKETSEALVREIVSWFRRTGRAWVSAHCYLDDEPTWAHTRKPIDPIRAHKRFRDKLSEQLSLLVGTELRWVAPSGTEEYWCVYYE